MEGKGRVREGRGGEGRGTRLWEKSRCNVVTKGASTSSAEGFDTVRPLQFSQGLSALRPLVEESLHLYNPRKECDLG